MSGPLRSGAAASETQTHRSTVTAAAWPTPWLSDSAHSAHRANSQPRQDQERAGDSTVLHRTCCHLKLMNSLFLEFLFNIFRLQAIMSNSEKVGLDRRDSCSHVSVHTYAHAHREMPAGSVGHGHVGTVTRSHYPQAVIHRYGALTVTRHTHKHTDTQIHAHIQTHAYTFKIDNM